MKKLLILSFLAITVVQYTSLAQRKKKSKTNTVTYDKVYLDGLQWRSIGPFRGGRSAAVTGVQGKPNLYYFGATGGGVWRTKDAGNTWENISDGFFGGSIGAIAVSDWDPNVIYVGGGEVTVRGNVSYGSGMWKSVDAGTTWQSIGLKKSRHVPRVRIHPKDPDLVYAAVLGDLFKSSAERGIYRSKDGGITWDKILFVNEDAGAVDLVLDPNNPRIMYASTWRIRRTPYSLESGGEGSSLWKSTNGGDNWENISANKGLPDGVWGISGVTISPVNSERVWAIIENEDGGVYRSDDAGKTWKRINQERKLRQRAWYYTRIYADTQDEDRVYVMNVRYHRSKDGGKTFETFNAPHGDHHDFWVDPQDNQRMVIGDDGGAQVSFDGGENWSTYENQPTGQFYRITTDNAFPYRIYGAQQDNSTVRIKHRSDGTFIDKKDWESTAGGESAHITVKPDNNDIVYGGSYDGFLTRVNHKTNEVRGINVWPDNPMGHGAEGMKYRFQWNFPIFSSPHEPNILYTASNHLHISRDEGQSWEIISPDLTRNDPAKQVSSGGPITKDNTSVEYYCTIFAAVESHHEAGVIWAGSDDGLIQITRDGGDNWANVTPSQLPEWTMINSMEIDPFNKGGLYVAGTRYKLGDYQPYLYKTKDYGNTWQKITTGIPQDHFTRVVRADPERQGLLYAGTESGMYISFDDGDSWQPFQQNLPIVPITDLVVKENNLIAATQGRSFWMIDDLTPLHQLNKNMADSRVQLFQPMNTYRMSGGKGKTSKTAGTNHPGGVIVNFFLKDTVDLDTVRLAFHSGNDELVRTFSSHPIKESQEIKLPLKPGMNTLNWDMRYPGARTFEGMVLWWATTEGPLVIPGKYTVKLHAGGLAQEQSFELFKDPRSSASQEDLKEQFEFLLQVRNKLSETNNAIIDIRNVRKQIEHVKSKDLPVELKKLAQEILKDMQAIEEALYQTKNESPQDPLNFPIRLNNKLGHLASLAGIGDNRPTNQSIAFYEEVSSQIDTQLDLLEQVFTQRIPELNKQVFAQKIEAIKLDD
ncbi:MAG: glycosyl hydrolase [Cyclobacteriaceae bacterium]|nr:glycosyl hydrolase [Cyclobacteriaceae bacterium HetDA_MAG_MS6]